MSNDPHRRSYRQAMTRRRFLLSAGAAGSGLMLGMMMTSERRADSALLSGKQDVPMAIEPQEQIVNSVPTAAKPIPLSAVRLTGGPLKHAQDLDHSYLLQLDPDRMMAYFRIRAGLQAKAPGYDGWDGDGRNLTGHIAGHYLSAASLMYAATGDERLLIRTQTIVDQMKEVQNSDGYLGALEGGKAAFAALSTGEIRSGGFDLNGLWSPWYVQHKIFAGLRDAYRYTGNSTALDIQIKFAGWVSSVLDPLSDDQIQQMLRTEFGGMGEVLADLYADTGDLKWLKLSDKFEHRSVLEPLASHEDKLGGLHANTQIPKLVGSLKRYMYTGSQFDAAAATFFWDAVVDHHSYGSGGHGKDEYFGPPDDLSERVDGRTDESCNVYNMLKLTRGLFALQPDVKYAEFQERALFNHVLGSMDPTDGRTCYMVPVGRGVQHEYQDMFESFTCCVGTGMENHALHGYGIYHVSDHRLWVNLYTPSIARWNGRGVTIKTETTLPEGDTVSIVVDTPAEQKFTLTLRRPSWAGSGFRVAVNGKNIESDPSPGSFFDITREWSNGDRVEMVLPKHLRAEPLPDNAERTALFWGPLMLAGDMGPEPGDPSGQPISGNPVFIAGGLPVHHWLIPTGAEPVVFRGTGYGRETATGGPLDIDLVPFYRLHRRTYAAYWDIYTPSEWQTKLTDLIQSQQQQQLLDAQTVAFAQPGEMQAERDFNEQGENSTPEMILGKHGRRGSGWFSFDLPIDAAHPMTLIVTYCTEEFAERRFKILADGQIIGSQTIERTPPGSPSPQFYDVQYSIPQSLCAGKTKLTVRFEATDGKEIAAVYGLRTIRADVNTPVQTVPQT